MKYNNSSKRKISRTRILIFTLEISLFAFLLITWLSSDSLQESKNLWILFFYNFISQFIIAIVPQEPVHLYFSKFYAPLIVTLVSIGGTLLTEFINYSTFEFVVELKSFDKIKYRSFVKNIVAIFNKVPFLAIWIAGFAPVPFYPFRFLVVLARYPVYKYLFAVFLSRTPRFFVLALIGHAIKIPDYLLAIFFVVLIIIALASVIKRLVFKNKKANYSANEILSDFGS
jgi:membrane protein YqaA with SNARE-associated domain